MMVTAQRVKTEFRQLASLHVDFIQTQWRAYGVHMGIGTGFLYLALFLFAFGIVRLFDGLSLYIIDGGSVATDASLLTGVMLLLVGLALFGLASFFLKKTKDVTRRVFREIGEDIQWMKKLL